MYNKGLKGNCAAKVRRVLRSAVLGTAIILGGALLENSASAASLSSMTGFEKAFGYKGDAPPKGFTVQLTGTSSPAAVFWPGEEANFNFQIVNNTDQPLKANAKWQIVQYATRTDPDDSFNLFVEKVKDLDSVPFQLDIPAKGYVQPTVKLPIPAKFGGYAVFFEVDGQGKQLAATCCRTPKATPGKVQHPSYAMDVQNPAVAPLFQRIGVKGTRIEWGFLATDEDGKDTKNEMERFGTYMKTLNDNDITVMVTVASSGDQSKMPLGNIRSYLNEKNEGPMGYPGDFACLPQYDEAFERWNKIMAREWGWPKGPINAIELWNEPWEGISISGWGADMLRFRELFTHMAQGIEAGCKQGNTHVLIGGACSSMNTEDKLLADGNDEPFLKWLDFTSIHYQPMCAQPAVIKKFAQRKSPNGPTRVWDTESWIANSEDRVAAVIASMRSIGQERTAGVLHDSARNVTDVDVRKPDGKTERVTVVEAMAPAAAVAAEQTFIGERKFKGLLFQNGLPWVYIFEGEKNADDGTVVVVGDLGGVYERNLTLFRNVLGTEARKRSIAVHKELDALAPDAPADTRKALLKKLKTAEVLDKGTMAIENAGGKFLTYDFFGNPIESAGGKLVVPLDGLGYFVRTDGSPGSFAKLLDALKTARVEGYEPVDIVAKDLLGRVDAKTGLRLSVTNILNRPIEGKLDVKLGTLQLGAASQTVKFAANETKEIVIPITGGAASLDNTYALVASFDAGADGKCEHAEQMHVNVISKLAVNVDGNLDEWKDALPQPIRAQDGAGKNLTEKAWLPFVKFDESVSAGGGVASGYLAYDDQNFYFAAKIADATPHEGSIRYAKRNDDEYFYPDKITRVTKGGDGKENREELTWPSGVRHYSYRKDPDNPSGEGKDNVQIGFNVLPVEQTDWLPNAPGVMPKYAVYKSTDYEYVLNQVADKFGGGTEVWRLLAPGTPRKHFYPRQPKAAKDGGPVENAKLAMKRDGNTRIVELAIPWSELPDVKARLDKNEPIKFTFRVNDDKGPSYELNGGRSVSKADSYALHNFWATSWATETEFAFEKK